jgi:hypothetical protein
MRYPLASGVYTVYIRRWAKEIGTLEIWQDEKWRTETSSEERRAETKAKKGGQSEWWIQVFVLARVASLEHPTSLLHEQRTTGYRLHFTHIHSRPGSIKLVLRKQ